ncbi:MAG TPA: hypothetical protein PKY12_04690 [Catalimonadaceae bacterium]|jgi:hypothetical protein|nr:hypothetical protein [Catalimonadaceae bacterium]
MSKRPNSIKAGLVISFIAWIALYQFSKEIFEWARPLVFSFYGTKPGSILLMIFKNYLHFTADNPDFFIKIGFSLAYILSYLIFMGLYFGYSNIKPLLITVFSGFLVLSVALNILGKAFHFESAVLLSRNTNDLMVSPFMLVFLFPVVKLYFADLGKTTS